MRLPIGFIVGALSTLAERAAEHYVTKRKAARDDGKASDPTREIADLQLTVEKQAAFIETLTEQARALALQVQKQEIALAQIRIFLVVLVGFSLCLFIAILWLALRHA